MYYEIDSDGSYSVGNFYVILSTQGNVNNYQSSFYNVTFEISFQLGEPYLSKSVDSQNAAMLEAAEWCEENCEEEWLIGCSDSSFRSEEDAFAFKLRWI